MDHTPHTIRTLSFVVVAHCTVAVTYGTFLYQGYPTGFKASRVTPIFKGGVTSYCSNYRPVSITNSPSKLSEGIIYDRLYHFPLQNKLIYECQFGFQKGSSTTSAAMTLVHRCIDSIEAKRYTAIIFIDIQKAFDCVDHEILLIKLNRLGIRGHLHSLIGDDLFARRQKVKIENHESGFRYVRNGVPQDAVLSTLLFIFFINDIFDLRLKGYLQLFADDAALVYSYTDLAEPAAHIQHDLELLTNWFYNNLLFFNVKVDDYTASRSRHPRLIVHCCLRR